MQFSKPIGIHSIIAPIYTVYTCGKDYNHTVFGLLRLSSFYRKITNLRVSISPGLMNRVGDRGIKSLIDGRNLIINYFPRPDDCLLLFVVS